MIYRIKNIAWFVLTLSMAMGLWWVCRTLYPQPTYFEKPLRWPEFIGALAIIFCLWVWLKPNPKKAWVYSFVIVAIVCGCILFIGEKTRHKMIAASWLMTDRANYEIVERKPNGEITMWIALREPEVLFLGKASPVSLSKKHRTITLSPKEQQGMQSVYLHSLSSNQVPEPMPFTLTPPK